MLTLTQINYFLAALAAGSLTQAAEELSVAQPTLSEQIRKLEQNLGVSVFTRAKQGLTLTEAGEKFLPYARKVSLGVVEAAESVSGVRELQEGSLSFGMFSSGQYVLSGLVPAFRRLHPNISVRILGSNSAQVADAVRSGRLEAGVVALPVDDRGLTISDALWSCEAAYFHLDPAVTSRPLSVEALTQRPLVLSDASWSNTDPTRRQLNERAQTQGISLRPDIEVETGAAALAIAASGAAGVVASIPVAEALGYTATLHRASLDPPLIETFAVVSRDPANLSPATSAMVDLVHEHMGRLHSTSNPAGPLP